MTNKNKYIPFLHVVKVRPSMNHLENDIHPVGSISLQLEGQIQPDWHVLDGSYLPISDYPELFGVVGHWCSRTIMKKRLFGLIKYRIPNPDFRDGFIELPNSL